MTRKLSFVGAVIALSALGCDRGDWTPDWVENLGRPSSGPCGARSGHYVLVPDGHPAGGCGPLIENAPRIWEGCDVVLSGDSCTTNLDVMCQDAAGFTHIYGQIEWAEGGEVGRGTLTKTITNGDGDIQCTAPYGVTIQR